ncbi:fat body protein 2-like isoform X2 [Rhodnius prolixus]|uniref:Putative alcohol dehydrogenase n=3 Tax=Rhodnius prolixus TaxID=13249 RepID=R4FNT5_RHOPR
MEPCNKVSIVIGGTTGIGLAIANELLLNNVKHVIVTGQSSCEGKAAVKELNRKYGERATFVKLDQKNFQQYEGVFKQSIEHGGPDIVVNSEEIIRDKIWDYEIDINMKGPIQGTLLAIKYMGPNKPHGGVVVNLASIFGMDGFSYLPVYAGTKAGIIGFCRSVGDCTVYQDTKVRVVALCPGITVTNELDKIKENQVNKRWGIKASSAIDDMPKQQPDHVARAVLYVIRNGPSASVWIVEGAQILKTFIPNRKDISETIACLD